MAKSPETSFFPDEWSLPEGWTWSDIGHGALDIVGLVPVFGEPADLANAAWYVAEQQYLEAGLSLISLVPIVGDAIGKGGKLAKRLGGKAAQKVLDAVKAMDFAKVLGPFRSHPTLGSHIDKILKALEDWRDELAAKVGKNAPGGKAPCPHAAEAEVLGTKVLVSNTEVPAEIWQKLTERGREKLASYIKEFEQNGIKVRKDKAAFYSGFYKGQPVWKIINKIARKKDLDCIEIASGGLLDRMYAEKASIHPSAIDWMNKHVSRALARSAEGKVEFFGDLDKISGTSIFRTTELPELLSNANVAEESKQALRLIEGYLNGKYGVP